jgi:hypothetical protein
MMKPKLDMDRIVRGLGAERLGPVEATGGYLGAVQLLAEIAARFRMPRGGGRSTDPRWTERRLVPLAPRTLERLEKISARVQRDRGVRVEPMQLAALLIERTADQLSAEEASKRVRLRAGGRARRKASAL